MTKPEAFLLIYPDGWRAVVLDEARATLQAAQGHAVKHPLYLHPLESPDALDPSRSVRRPEPQAGD